MGKILSFFGKKKKHTISDRTIDLSPPGLEINQSYLDTYFYRCKFHHTDTWPHFFRRCQFVECEFELRRSGRIHMSSDCSFFHCHFTFKKASHFMFNKGHFFHFCTFKGTLKDCVFALDPQEEKYSRGGVFDCDFTELEFDILDFRGRDKSRNLSFPKWPIVWFEEGDHLNPNYELKFLPVELKYYMIGYHKRFFGFNVLDLRQVMKDPEELWYAIFDADFLKFTDKSEKPIPDPQVSKKIREQNIRHNEIHDKYRDTFLSLIMMASIVGILRQGKDVVLTLMIKIEDSDINEEMIKITLVNCSKAELVGETEYKITDTYNKKFFLKSMDVDAKTDTLILKGPRKKMGRLHLTYSHAHVEKC